MNAEQHYLALAQMYLAAPINAFYQPTIAISQGHAVITIELHEKFHHAAGAVHGSVYFKLLDDAAFFAVNSLEYEVFVLTTAFTTYLTRPVSSGTLRAEGRVVNQNKSQFIVEAVVYDSENREVGRGSGLFVRGKLPLKKALGYATK
ncbi:MAG: PaaI family thioesterase [Pseudomonadota bacterium]